MKLLFTGRGKSGSWAIRGQQLGTAIGATVKQGITVDDCKAVDLVVVVKRVTDEIMAPIRNAGVPWLFDALDFYPQPTCSAWNQSHAIEWVQGHLRRYAPSAIIWPNERMRRDCDIGLPGIVLRHHHRPGIKVNPIRPKVKTVGYEGSPVYLGAWKTAIAAECARRGWSFVVNPENLADLDIVLAVRDSSGYVQKNWKSGVKLSNAHGSGTPFIGQQEAGYIEASSGCEYWMADSGGLKVCFDWLTDQGSRELVSQRFLQKAYTVDQAAKELQVFLDGL